MEGKFPVRPVIALWVCLMAQGLSFQQLFSYAGFLVIHFGIADRDTAGYYVGFLASVAMLSRAIRQITHPPLSIAHLLFLIRHFLIHLDSCPIDGVANLFYT
eukprot:c4545_g1_i1.p1 GENE.c4545_g1_i1~~c4545_g1_i1.p1  ORF type:complete len:115 (+),score=7.47 c4545_g1_i1:41-346(+)